jgi:hypothetical protein
MEAMNTSLQSVYALARSAFSKRALLRQAAVYQPTAIDPQPWHGEGAAKLRKMVEILPRSYACPRAKVKPAVEEGDVFQSCWAHVPWTEHFVDIEGESSGRPAPRQEIRISLQNLVAFC